MIHDTYSESEHAAVKSTLYHNKNYLDCVQSHNSPFHHKKKMMTWAFDARVTALFYHLLSVSVSVVNFSQVDDYISNLGHVTFLHWIEKICQYIFTATEQLLKMSEFIDHEFSAHAKFLQQMKTYKTLKYVIKHADVNLIKHALTQCCVLFHESDHIKYIFLSLYMIWLTQINAANKSLQSVILTNELVNLHDIKNSWFEMNRLNEFFNLQMKTLMITWRTSTIDCADLFHHTALSESYCTDLKVVMKAAFGRT